MAKRRKRLSKCTVKEIVRDYPGHRGLLLNYGGLYTILGCEPTDDLGTINGRIGHGADAIQSKTNYTDPDFDDCIDLAQKFSDLCYRVFENTQLKEEYDSILKEATERYYKRGLYRQEDVREALGRRIKSETIIKYAILTSGTIAVVGIFGIILNRMNEPVTENTQAGVSVVEVNPQEVVSTEIGQEYAQAQFVEVSPETSLEARTVRETEPVDRLNAGTCNVRDIEDKLFDVYCRHNPILLSIGPGTPNSVIRVYKDHFENGNSNSGDIGLNKVLDEARDEGYIVNEYGGCQGVKVARRMIPDLSLELVKRIAIASGYTVTGNDNDGYVLGDVKENITLKFSKKAICGGRK